MSDYKKKPAHGEPISEEQLDAVADGVTEYGDFDLPMYDKHCWFRADGESREDGRTRCKTECKGMFDENRRPVALNIFHNNILGIYAPVGVLITALTDGISPVASRRGQIGKAYLHNIK